MIRFKALSEKGSVALKKAYEGVNNSPKWQRKAFNRLYRNMLLSDNPFEFSVESRVNMNPAVVISIFEDNLKAYNVEKDVDYGVIIDE